MSGGTRELINGIFEEEALAIGGLVAVHPVDDDLVWRLIRSLDSIRRRALRRTGGGDPGENGTGSGSRFDPAPHPAVEEFLRAIRKD